MIAVKEFEKRRKALMQAVGKDDVVIVPAAKELVRNGDASYPFRQNSDFHYLTGFNEPEAILLLLPKRKDGEYILFNRPRHMEREAWEGPRAGQSGAKKDFAANQAFPVESFEEMLPELLEGRRSIHYPLGVCSELDQQIMAAMKLLGSKARKGLVAPVALIDLAKNLHPLRLIKSSAEIKLIQKAVDISTHAHVGAMKSCRPEMYEYELEAILNYEFQRHGARYPAYSSIVGAGKNACVLHYTKNNEKINKNDLVLIDAGAEFDHYASDVTRTFPASGKFSSEQKAIYQLVLAAQQAAIKTVKPGASWIKAQQTILKIITQGLIDLKILKGSLDSLLEKKAYLPFYMHSSGHWLGLDVHDAGPYCDEAGKWLGLQAGMALTVEPGIYISDKIPGVASKWHNIGVRIEDDVLVTSKGSEVLSKAIPKTVFDIEALMAG